MLIIAHVLFFSVTLDTPMNRKFMPDADQTTWTPMEFVAEYVSLFSVQLFLFSFEELLCRLDCEFEILPCVK